MTHGSEGLAQKLEGLFRGSGVLEAQLGGLAIYAQMGAERQECRETGIQMKKASPGFYRILLCVPIV